MSSSSSPTTSTTSSPSPSGTAPSSGGSQPSSSLYLCVVGYAIIMYQIAHQFTFLATLFLLLLVSAAIVIRSYILRRRFRQRVAEALTSGVIFAPTEAGVLSSCKFLEKPKLWDVALQPAASKEWKSIMPLAAKLTKTSADGASSSGASPEHDEITSPSPRFPLLHRPFARRRATASPLLAASPSTSTQDSTAAQPGGIVDTTSDALLHASPVQVALLLMMPNPNRSAYSTSVKGKGRSSRGSWDDEEGVPDVVLAVGRVYSSGVDRSPEL